MFNDEKLVLHIISKTLVYSLIIIGIMFIGIRDAKPYVLGFIFGTIIGILGFKLIEKTVTRAVTMESSKAYFYSIFHYFIRYSIYATVLIIAAIADYLNFLTTVLGLLMIKIVIFSSTVINTDYKDYKKNKD
ncbi:ATP synthase subunit I [Tepidimicrobium xylanilyticum]|uniref:ATP synthase I chain n=1 Tax=Tepidimicrobium xylanilyticum TaxID=1123352 RepID=A0A1H2R1F5_9FIRM|nr:ATP synthase subunit I [Tepidimicrobium xylanilyticum]SDW12704.1 ATP synthase I chain [Tepidimicrobium xylanilyticum]